MNHASPHFPHGLPQLEGAASMEGLPSHAKLDRNLSMDDESVLNNGDDVFDAASADLQSSERASVDVRDSSLSNMEAGFVPLRVRISVDSDDENHDASLTTSENFDSLSERMATLSNTDSVSPSESFKEFFALSKVSSITFNEALRQLNNLNSGVPSLDTSLLENTSEEGFRFRVMELALSNHLSLDDEVIHDILNALSPIVRENFKQKTSVKEDAEYYGNEDMPVAKPTADDDDDNSDGLQDDVILQGFQDASGFERSGDGQFLPYSARGLPVRIAIDAVSEEHEVYHFSHFLKPSMSFQLENPEVGAQHINVPSGEIENQNCVDYGHGKGKLSMSYEEPDLMQHCAKNAENQDRALGENNQVKNTEVAPSCGLVEADANDYITSDKLQTSVNKAKSMREFEQGATIKDGSKAEDFLTNDNLLYGIKGGAVAAHPEAMFVNKKDHLFPNRKSREETDNGAFKCNDEEEKTESTDERDLSLKLPSAPATGMPFIGNVRPCLCVQHSGLGQSIPSLMHVCHAAPWSNESSVSSSSIASKTDQAKGTGHIQKKLQMIGVKFLRLVHRLEQSAHNVVVAQVLYRLELIEQLRSKHTSTDFIWENMMSIAEEQEAAGQGDLDSDCTILVLGKSGVGKSATLNSLFDEVKSRTDAYKPCTKKVNEIFGTVKGIKLRVIDTPGLLTSFADQQYNFKIMLSVKQYIKKSPPDIVLYFDRLDLQCRDHGDVLLVRTITDALGSAIWHNAIIVLTHGSSDPPDGANGLPIPYELFVAQRSRVVQQTIQQAAGDIELINPVSLVENHKTCQVNKAGQSVLPSGEAWKPQLLLLCFASKSLAIANNLMKLHDSSSESLFWVRPQVPSFPFLLSSMLQSRAELKLKYEQVDNEEVSDPEEGADLDDEEDYDDLPFFRRLTRDELRLLDEEQRRLYHKELEYREKLFMKKQLKDDRVGKKELKRRLDALPKEASVLIEEHLEEASPVAVPVLMPDMALPLSFDSDNPTHRYRFLDTEKEWHVHPVVDMHGWDHECGYDGLSLEKYFVVSKKVPVALSGKISKDKKEASVQMGCATTIQIGDGKVKQAELDIQTLGKDVLYMIGSETNFINLKKNKITCGLLVTMLGDTVAAGMKLEDSLLIGKRFKLIMNGGALAGQKDVAYGGSLEASCGDRDCRTCSSLSTLGVYVTNWKGDFAIGGNLQLQFLLGRTMVVGRANWNNKKSGQVSIRASSSDQLQMVFIGLIPLLRAFINNKISGSN